MALSKPEYQSMLQRQLKLSTFRSFSKFYQRECDCFRGYWFKSCQARYATFAKSLERQMPPKEQVKVKGLGDQHQGGSFMQLGLMKEIEQTLAEQNIFQPTEIQRLAIPQIIGGEQSLFIGSHTGSGKTYTYLLPLAQLLKDDEMRGVVGLPRRPRAVILCPTRELNDQIVEMCRTICKPLSIRTVSLTGSQKLSTQKKMLLKPVDIVVATPQRLLQHLESNNILLGEVGHIVLDEVDNMLEEGFDEQVKELLQPLRHKQYPARSITVAATLTHKVKKLLNEEFPGHLDVRTRTMHKGVSGAQHVFVPIMPSTDKMEALKNVISGDPVKGRKVIVFCNTMNAARAVEYCLRDVRIPAVSCHGGMPADLRARDMEAFLNPPDPQAPQPVLVTTDIAARGLNFNGQADHVINFNFPMSSIDYLHRTGRTARAGRAGKVTNFVSKREKTLAGRVKFALQNDFGLDSLSADPAVIPPWEQRAQEVRKVEQKVIRKMRKGIRGARRVKLMQGDAQTVGELMSMVRKRTQDKVKGLGEGQGGILEKGTGGKRGGGRKAQNFDFPLLRRGPGMVRNVDMLKEAKKEASGKQEKWLTIDEAARYAEEE